MKFRPLVGTGVSRYRYTDDAKVSRFYQVKVSKNLVSELWFS
jgi:hypothetical protein